MRRIEFRAWDTKLKRWLFGFKECGGFHIMGECIACGEWPPGPIERWNDYVVEQFTGIRDKNGVEIYEGDIVEWNWLNDKRRAVVTWDDKRAMFFAGDRKENLLSAVFVIGNIHENPELLEGNHETRRSR